MATIHTVDRPYTLTFRSGAAFLLSGIEAQRLIDSEPYATYARGFVTLPDYGDDDGRSAAVIVPATLGGGPAFLVTR